MRTSGIASGFSWQISTLLDDAASAGQCTFLSRKFCWQSYLTTFSS